ncbi:ECF transporter S component [Metabacillus sp. RGM 3146]|uniref:ECF transporter S component n=1 Tax=Metabacillus sp. RGM 3146 TaxID=3401092 RepID=UPI003B9948B1
MRVSKTRKQVVVGVLSSIAYLLMMLEIPYPGPLLLKIDFSDIPAIIAAIVFGPVAGIVVEGIKNLLHYMIQGSGTGVPVGECANFISGLLFILPVSWIYKKTTSTKGVASGLVIGTLCMTVLMGILNYFVFIPAYTLFFHAPATTSQQMIQTIVAFILPFNMVKGVLITTVFLLLYAKLKTWLSRQTEVRNAA